MIKPKVIGSGNHIHQYDLREFKGRILFVTDVHGCFDLLHEELNKVAFDSNKDILFSGGDWTDRSADSKYVLDYLTEPWIHSVQANHEALFIGAYDELFTPSLSYTRCLLANGGEWVNSIDKPTKKAIYEVFKAMPLGIEILLANGQKIGIVHASTPYNDWEQFKNITHEELEWDGLNKVQWCREQYDRKGDEIVKNIDFCLHGHSPTTTGEVERYGNRIYCDAGSFFRDKLNLIEITNGIQ